MIGNQLVSKSVPYLTCLSEYYYILYRQRFEKLRLKKVFVVDTSTIIPGGSSWRHHLGESRFSLVLMYISRTFLITGQAVIMFADKFQAVVITELLSFRLDASLSFLCRLITR